MVTLELSTQSNTDWLFITQSMVLEADWLILGNKEKTMLFVFVPYYLVLSVLFQTKTQNLFLGENSRLTQETSMVINTHLLQCTNTEKQLLGVTLSSNPEQKPKLQPCHV